MRQLPRDQQSDNVVIAAPNMKGQVPESWLCVDCGFDTAPGCPNRAEVETAFAAVGKVTYTADDRSEIYHLRTAVWAQAGIEPFGGCLCIGCLENRLGRKLKPKDFKRNHPLNKLPCTPRLLQRRGQRENQREQWAEFLAQAEQEA